MYFYDWKAIGVKAPSVVPELERIQLAFRVTGIQAVAPHEAPPVLPPYNVTMTVDAEIRGTVDGRERVIETNSSLIPAGLQKGAKLVLSVGKSKPAQVFEISEAK